MLLLYQFFGGRREVFSIVLLCVFGVNKILAAVSIYFSITARNAL
jgi:hypothetical protein